MSFLRVLSLFLVVFAVSFPAKAEYFVWKDDITGVSVVYPDRWARVHNQKADDILTIAAPMIKEREDLAMCRIRARDDNRFSIYPIRYSDEIVRVHYDQTFWTNYLQEYNNPVLNLYRDNQGLGRAPASMVDFTYETSYGPKMLRRGMAYVGLYDNKAYIFECTVKASSYHAWFHVFTSILQSVDFKNTVAGYPSGKYRYFSDDKPLLINNGYKKERYRF